MRKYRLVAKKGEGTFSEVLKAQNVKDGKYHAIKCMKNRFDSIDQVAIRIFKMMLFELRLMAHFYYILSCFEGE
jgi:serine/threonine protein kinase